MSFSKIKHFVLLIKIMKMKNNALGKGQNPVPPFLHQSSSGKEYTIAGSLLAGCIVLFLRSDYQVP